MRQPFLDFAKAHFRYQYCLKPTKGFSGRILALRVLEQSLREMAVDETPRIENADGSVFARAAQLAKDTNAQGTSYAAGVELRRIAKFISDNHLVKAPFHWSNPLRVGIRLNRIGKEYEEKRKKKLPTDETLRALGDAFRIARDPRDVLITSVGVLLLSAPNRICEVLTLPAECEFADSSQGKEWYALRWWPAKGAEPMLKWIVDSMIDLAKDAIARIRTVTEPWRRVARWYEENPDNIYLPKEYSYLRQRKEISLLEIGEVIGVSDVETWLRYRNIKSIRRPNHGVAALYAFSDVEEAVLADLPIGFPFLDQDTKLRYSEALFVVPRNFFHETRSVYKAMIEPVPPKAISCGFGTTQKRGDSSVFTRLGIVSSSGEPIIIRTHQYRHLLNTIGQSSGVSQTDIAMWSGRKSVTQNVAYDHVTSEELTARVRQEGGGAIESGLKKLNAPRIVVRSDFDASKTLASHVTQVGMCTWDYSQSTCQKHRDCVNCSFSIYEKGDPEKGESAVLLLAENEALLAEAEKSGAGRWIDHQLILVANLRQIVGFFKDPNVPNGARMRLSPKGEHLPVEVAIESYLQGKLPNTNKPALPASPDLPPQLPALPSASPEDDGTEDAA